MINEQWIQTLATADFDRGGWRAKNPSLVQKQLEQAVSDTLRHLFNEIEDCREVFNQYSTKGTILRLLEINSPSQSDLQGLLMLYGPVQLKLIFSQNQIIARVVTVNGFTSDARTCLVMRPCFDALGSLYWKSENGVLMNLEMMVKTLFETIVREFAILQPQQGRDGTP